MEKIEIYYKKLIDCLKEEGGELFKNYRRVKGGLKFDIQGSEFNSDFLFLINNAVKQYLETVEWVDEPDFIMEWTVKKQGDKIVFIIYDIFLKEV